MPIAALDITDPDRVAQVAARCADVTLLVNNAGVLKYGTFIGAPSLDAAPARYRTAMAQLRGVPSQAAFAPLACTQLRAAHATFGMLGALPWLARTAGELSAAGQDTPQDEPSASSTLTAQERRIAELAASGLSNKQIAARLYVSPRTVSAHLYRFFPKLGISSRAVLRDALVSGD